MNHVLSMLVNLSLAIRYGPSLRSGPTLMVLVKDLPTYTYRTVHNQQNQVCDRSISLTL